MKKSIFFLYIFILFSCKEKFSPSDYKGTWVHYTDVENYYNFPSITFRKDSVYLEDAYTYIIKGKFKVTKNKISFNLKNDTLKYDFYYNSKDSTILIGNHKYVFWEGYSYDSNFIDYELINIKKDHKIKIDSLRTFENGFHLFKNSNDSIKIKLNDKIVSDFNQIRDFIWSGPIHFGNFGTVIYIGKGIKLNNIIESYKKLRSVNRRKVILITEFDYDKNLYSAYLDYIEIWDEQLNLEIGDRIELPKSDSDIKRIFFQKYNPTIITINTLDDFNQLKNIKKDKNYLIQINSNMSIETYISLKEKISEIRRNIKNLIIRTEFN